MTSTYDYYRIFYYVAKYKSFTGAANILLNSQPNITRAMNNLEHELGCRLFLRSNRGVTLTPEGEKLYAHVRIAQEQLQAGEYELAREKKLESGYISIGVSEIALHMILLPVLRRFRQTYPGIHIRLTNHSTLQAIASVKNGLAELSVVTPPLDIPKDLKTVNLMRFRDILIAGPGYEEQLKDRSLTLQELAKFPIVCLGPRTTTYEFYSRFFAEHGLLLEPAVLAATTEQVLPMVTNDLGLGFLPEQFVEESLKNRELVAVSLEEEIPHRHICLIKDKSRPLSIAAQELEKLLLEAGMACEEG